MEKRRRGERKRRLPRLPKRRLERKTDPTLPLQSPSPSPSPSPMTMAMAMAMAMAIHSPVTMKLLQAM